ncbi:hypothetical protein AB5V95_01935 [Metamycoplasma spumans]|uniref:hypothetical protein n=1 Tax=Metamycoplasma spumans TaxID=92406 RepID=UPI0034DD6A8C
MKTTEKLHEIIKLAKEEITPLKSWKNILRNYIGWLILVLFFGPVITFIILQILNDIKNVYWILFCVALITFFILASILSFIRNYSAEKAIYYSDYDLYKSLKFIKLNFRIRCAFSYLKELLIEEKKIKKTKFENKNEKEFYKYFDYFEFDGISDLYKKYISKLDKLNKYEILEILLNEYKNCLIGFELITIFLSKNNVSKRKLKNIISTKELSKIFEKKLNNSFELYWFLKIKKYLKKNDEEIKTLTKRQNLTIISIVFSIVWYVVVLTLLFYKKDYYKESSILIGFNKFNVISILCYLVLITYCIFISFAIAKNIDNKTNTKLSKTVLIIMSVFLWIFNVSFIVASEYLGNKDIIAPFYIFGILFSTHGLIFTSIITYPLSHLYLLTRDEIKMFYIEKYIEKRNENINIQ